MSNFRGADTKYKPVEQRVDTRLLSHKMSDYFNTPEGASVLNFSLLTSLILSFSMPLLPLISTIVTKVMSILFLRTENKMYSLPYRMPEHFESYDASEMMPNKPFNSKNKKFYKPQGVSYYGQDRRNRMQVWATDNDERRHSNIFATTGAGKTELIYTLITAQLIRNSGAIVVDAKGDISLYRRLCNLVRRFGRDADLLCITFAIGNKDRNVAQLNKPTNSFNLMLNTTAGMLVELLSGLLDGDGGGDDMWKSRAIAYIGALTQPLVFLRDKKEIELSPSTYIDYMELSEIERFVYESNYNYEGFEEVIKPLRSYLTTLPGYNPNAIGNQAQQTNEQFGYITMQMTRSINDLSFTYGHIFGTAVGEIDITDVVLNRRFLAILLPSLERSIPTLVMISRLILASIKQMMASSLGSEIEGNIRINIESRPTTALNCFRIILDEVGYMMTTGMSIIPAQARSLNIAMVFAAQDYTDIERGSKEEAQAIWSNAAIKFIGGLTSGEDSEMWRRTSGAAGEIEQTVIERYDRKFTALYNVKYGIGSGAVKEKRSRVVYDEVAAQTKGEFTLIAAKKEAGGNKSTIAVVPFQSLYTGGLPEMDVTYVNDFVPISTANVKPPELLEQYETIEKELKQDSLSKYIMHTLSSGTVIRDNPSPINHINKLIFDVQNACEAQKDDDNFVNLMLEITLNTFGTALTGINSGLSYDPANRIETDKERKAFWSIEDAGKAAIDQLQNSADHEFRSDPEVQKAHFKKSNYDPTPKEVKEKVSHIHDTGRAVDLSKEQDKDVKELISKTEKEGNLSIMQEAFTESDRQKDALIRNLIEVMNQKTMGKLGVAHYTLLKNVCSEVDYIKGLELTNDINDSLIEEVQNHLNEMPA